MTAELCSEIGIFAVSLDRASPAWIAWQIQYRRVHVRVAENASFFCSDAADVVDKRPIPRAGNAYLRWEACRARMSDATYTFVGEINGDAEPGLLDEESLNRVDGLGVPGKG